MIKRLFATASLVVLSAHSLAAQGEIKLKMRPEARSGSNAAQVSLNVAEVEGEGYSISGVKEGNTLASGRTYTADLGAEVIIRGNIKTLKINNADILSAEIKGNQSLLKTLHIKDTGLQTLDFSGATNLEDVDLTTPTRFVSSQEPRNFNFSPLKQLKRLVLGIRPFTVQENGLRKHGSGTGQTQHIESVVLPEGGALEELYITNCGVSEINLGNLPMLKYLQCEATMFRGVLNLSNSPKLEEVWARLAWFDEVNMPHHPSLRRFHMLNGRQIKKLNLSHSPKLLAVIMDETESLEHIDVNACAVQMLSVAKCPNLRYVNILQNNITQRMTAFIDQLPTVANGTGELLATATTNERNILTDQDKAKATQKGWKVGTNLTSIEEIAARPMIYPTDATDMINIESAISTKARIYTMDGSLAHEATIDEGVNQIDLSALAKGVYIVVVGSLKQRISLR